jgi:hypothetical protein
MRLIEQHLLITCHRSSHSLDRPQIGPMNRTSDTIHISPMCPIIPIRFRSRQLGTASSRFNLISGTKRLVSPRIFVPISADTKLGRLIFGNSDTVKVRS